MAKNDMTDLFGEEISSYSRAQAIEDGVLIDVSDTKAADLFKHPVAITTALHAAISRGAGSDPETYNARLFDVIHMMTLKGRASAESDLFFRVKVGVCNLDLWGNCGPGDDMEPVITVGYPTDR